MEQHRNRSVVLDNDTLLLTEIESELWLCVKETPSHDAIHKLLRDEEINGTFHMRIDSRMFTIDPRMKDFKELSITE